MELCLVHANCQGEALIGLPIHPAIAKRFGLSFADAEYAVHDVRCKLLGETDFIGYLRFMAGNHGKIVADGTK